MKPNPVKTAVVAAVAVAASAEIAAVVAATAVTAVAVAAAAATAVVTANRAGNSRSIIGTGPCVPPRSFAMRQSWRTQGLPANLRIAARFTFRVVSKEFY